jgi:hypothetical protein
LGDAALDWADAVVLLVPHSEMDYNWLVRRSRLLFDTVHHFRDLRADQVVAL